MEHLSAGSLDARAKRGRGWRVAALLAGVPLVAAACGGGGTSSSAGSPGKPTTGTATSGAAPAGCGPIAKKYPQFEGKTLVDALTPFTPGYEAANPSNPSTYVGFDVSLLHEIGSCLGFKYTFKPMAFSSLIPTLQAGQANLVISDIFATQQRAKAVNFVTYEKVDDGILVRKGNPLHITAFNTSMCGARAAENTGFVEVPLVEKLAPSCRAAGKPAPVVQQYGNNADCIQAVLAGRADFYANDVNTVASAVKAHPGQLEKAATLQLPFSVGIAIAKPETTLLAAVDASVKQIQADGIEKKLLAKWGLSTGSEEAPTIVS